MKQRYFFGAVLVLLTLTWISLNTGAVKLHNVLNLIMGNGEADEVSIMQEIRGPRVMAAIIVGASLGMAGVLAQGALKNPLAEPVLLGTTGGSAFFTLLGILILKISIGSYAAIACGISGAIVSTFLTYFFGKNGKDGFAFVVIGIATSAMLISLVGITAVMINNPEARGVTFWSLGTISMATKSQVSILIPIAAICAVAAYFIAPELDYLGLGDLRAKHLGKKVALIRFLTFALIAVSVGTITSIFGQISFLALAVPHIARTMVGVRHRNVLIHSGLIGATLLLLADLIARTVATPNELPIGLMTALIGAPILIIAVRNWVKSHA